MQAVNNWVGLLHSLFGGQYSTRVCWRCLWRSSGLPSVHLAGGWWLVAGAVSPKRAFFCFFFFLSVMTQTEPMAK